MLAEVKDARQIEGEGTRRWFRDDDLDLIVWYDSRGKLDGFQLCYNKQQAERALTWRSSGSYQHNAIDPGEVPGQAKMSPILVAHGTFDKERIAQIFDERSSRIEPDLAELIKEKIHAYPGT